MLGHPFGCNKILGFSSILQVVAYDIKLDVVNISFKERRRQLLEKCLVVFDPEGVFHIKIFVSIVFSSCIVVWCCVLLIIVYNC